MSLLFVNLTDGASITNHEQRRDVRSHALRGRSGRKPRTSVQQCKRSGASCVQRWSIITCPACLEGKPCHQVHMYAYVDPRLNMRQPIWDDLAFVALPGQLTMEHRGALHESYRLIRRLLYPPRFCTETDHLVSRWFQLLFDDEAYLQATLAYAASFVDFLLGEKRLSPKALKHLSQAYALVSERLSGPDATSNETIATVTSMSLYQRLHQLRSIGMVHFQGLQKILALRGGMRKFAIEDRYLALKPWGLDLEFAMRDGHSLCFTGEDAPLPCFTQPSLSVPFPGFISSSLCSDDLHPDLTQTFLEMQSFAKLLNEIRENNKVDALDFTQHGQYLAYRLLTFAPLSELRRLPIADAEVYVALAASVVTLLPEYSGQHQRFDLLADVVREVTATSRPNGEMNPGFRLWMFFLAGIAITGSSDDEWVLPQLRILIRELGLGSWEKVKAQLQCFIWIPSLHDDAGHRLFDASEKGPVDIIVK